MNLYSSKGMMEMMDGSHNNVKEIAILFSTIGPQMIKDAEEAIKNEKWNEVGDFAHKLKTSLRLWQMDSLIDIAIFIEKNARDKNETEAIKEKFIELKKDFLLAIDGLRIEFDI